MKGTSSTPIFYSPVQRVAHELNLRLSAHCNDGKLSLPLPHRKSQPSCVLTIGATTGTGAGGHTFCCLLSFHLSPTRSLDWVLSRIPTYRCANVPTSRNWYQDEKACYQNMPLIDHSILDTLGSNSHDGRDRFFQRIEWDLQ